MKIKEEVKDMKNELENIKNESFATIILKDYKLANKRLFILAMSLLVALLISFGYIVYLLNDIETVTTEYVQDISDFETIENSNISNGE